MNDWQDRIVDSALHEISGQRPPNLSARIVLALQERSAGELPVLRQRRGVSIRTFVTAAAAMFFVTVAVAFFASRDNGLPAGITTVAQIDVAVSEGAIECVPVTGVPVIGGRAVMTIISGEHVRLTTHVGDRLLAAKRTTMRLAAFPTLTTGPATELEVRSMEFSMKNSVVAASSLTLGVVAGVVAWSTLTGPETATAGQVVHLETEAKETSDLAAENTLLRGRIQQLELENSRLLTVREEAPPAPPIEPDEIEPEAPPEVASTVMFDDPRYKDALAKVDWKLLGDVTKEMQPMVLELAKQMAETGEVSTELALQIQQLNAKLLAQMPAILEADLPGTGTNGIYTHPLIVANSLASTLASAGQPLNETQRAALSGLVRSFSAENDSIAAGQHEFAAEGLLQEIEMKERFYEEVSTRLTPEQFASIYPEGSRDYDGVSMFATGLMTHALVQPVKAKNAAEFAQRASSRLSEGLGLDDAATAKVRAIIDSMSANAPELWRHKSNKTERKLSMMRAGRTRAALRHQIAMLREISRQVSLTPEQKKKLSRMRRVLVPLP